MIYRFVPLFLLTIAISSAGAEPPTRVRFITTGWNTPTAQQFLRDADIFLAQPFDGCAIHARADTKPPHPFSSAHTAGSWRDVSFASTEAALDKLDPTTSSSSYLIIKANPGDADWLDDKAWFDVVEHWRTAARLAKRGRLRGLLFDPEPYTEPFQQFNYHTQANAAKHSFAEYAKAARKRGRAVMNAIAEEYPQAEFFSYFLMSYLVNDHRHRGPSPINASGRRKDFDWCLAGHNYGLLPAFLSGLLDASPNEMKFVDGCEYGYWLTEETDFAKLRDDVGQIGRLIVDHDVRDKYDRQVSIAFPIFLDIVHPTLIKDWTIQPEQADRLKILRRQLSAALAAGNTMVWFYGERGQWWPAAQETALWKNKDVYPHWNDLIPGCMDAIRDARTSAQPAYLVHVPKATVSASVGKRQPIDTWRSSSKSGSTAQIDLGETITICDARDDAAHGYTSVKPGERFRIQAYARQTGRGITQLIARYVDAESNWIVGRGVDAFAYPESGDPANRRLLTLDTVAPTHASKLVITLKVKRQQSTTDKAQFDGVEVHQLHLTRHSR